MSHSPEHKRQKAEAREKALHHLHNSAVDGKHDDMPMAERMYRSSAQQNVHELGEDMKKEFGNMIEVKGAY